MCGALELLDTPAPRDPPGRGGLIAAWLVAFSTAASACKDEAPAPAGTEPEPVVVAPVAREEPERTPPVVEPSGEPAPAATEEQPAPSPRPRAADSHAAVPMYGLPADDRIREIPEL